MGGLMADQGHDAGEDVAAMVPQLDSNGHPVRISVLTRAGCHLCDKALEAIGLVAADRNPPVGCSSIDVDHVREPLRTDLLTRYGDLLPVTFVDGRQHDYWVIDPVRLRQALSQR